MGRSGSEGSECFEAETGNLETAGEFTIKAVGVDVNHIQTMCQESVVFFPFGFPHRSLSLGCHGLYPLVQWVNRQRERILGQVHIYQMGKFLLHQTI